MIIHLSTYIYETIISLIRLQSRICRSKRRTMYIAAIRYGPNGTSVFGLNLFMVTNIHRTDMTVAIQKASMSELRPAPSPSIQPMPMTSFASPSPIQVPLDTSHKKAKGKAKIGPAKIEERGAIWNQE